MSPKPVCQIVCLAYVKSFYLQTFKHIHVAHLCWGGRIRTCEWRLQRPLPYHLATPQFWDNHKLEACQHRHLNLRVSRKAGCLTTWLRPNSSTFQRLRRLGYAKYTCLQRRGLEYSCREGENQSGRPDQTQISNKYVFRFLEFYRTFLNPSSSTISIFPDAEKTFLSRHNRPHI